jgi:hypothetical protein
MAEGIIETLRNGAVREIVEVVRLVSHWISLPSFAKN